MLLALQVTNFGLIDHLELAFGAGLNVITGETGAGKSMLIDAMELICGGRASADQVRTGQEQATVDAAFDLSGAPALVEHLRAMGLDDGVQVVIGREVNTSGRNICRINGRLATAASAREVAAALIDIHGQHEHHSLLEPAQHRALLDAYGGEGHRTLTEAVSSAYRDLRGLNAELTSVSGNSRDRAQREDLLRFQLAEIESAALNPGEDDELRATRHILVNAEKLATTVETAYAALFEASPAPARGQPTSSRRGGGAPPQAGARDALVNALGQLETAAALDPRIGGQAETLRTVVYTLDDLAQDLRRYREGIEFEPGRLEEVQSRLEVIATLRRKYADTVDGILRYAQDLRGQLDDLARSEETATRLEEEIARCRARLAVAAMQLSDARTELALSLQGEVAAELAELGMSAAVFEVSMQHSPDPAGIAAGDECVAFGPHGIDDVEFMLSSNPGEPPRRLARSASGGELSRVMLAIKTVLARADRIPSVIFDEIDAGVGGRTANAVGLRLARLGSTHQVLCVTHLPQIAAFADRHYVVTKESTDRSTRTNVRAVDGDERLEELARMLGGSLSTPATGEHVRELVRRSASQRTSG